MAFYDSLTKLPNRTLFMKRLNEQLKLVNIENAQGAVFFIDLDNFKSINDTIGHDYGDEFLLLHPYIEECEVQSFARKLLALFNGKLIINNKQMYITASIGIALYPKDGTDKNTILKNADLAMYKAKELGKNRFAFVDPKMYLSLERKTNIERVLRTTIENNELSIN